MLGLGIVVGTVSIVGVVYRVQCGAGDAFGCTGTQEEEGEEGKEEEDIVWPHGCLGCLEAERPEEAPTANAIPTKWGLKRGMGWNLVGSKLLEPP